MVDKLEAELALVKREVTKVKVVADEEKKKALLEQKMKLSVDYEMKLSTSISVADDKERVKWQKEVEKLNAVVSSLEDDKLELESK